jgi:uncharacterized protein (DUF1499 family)
LTALAWLLGLILPACGANGVAGLPRPAPIDMTHIERPATPNTFLAGPEGMTPAPDVITGEQPFPAPALYEKVRVLFAGQPGTYIAAEYPNLLQVHYVVRSAVLNFPDLVTVQVNPAAKGAASGAKKPGRSTFVIWSRSVYGRSDLGVNRKRTIAWLAALQQSEER